MNFKSFKIKRTELFFYIGYILLYVSYFLADINIEADTMSIICRFIRYFAYICITIQVFSMPHKKKGYLLFVFIFCISTVFALVTKDFYFCSLVMLIIASMKMKSIKILKLSRGILSISTVTVILLCMIGVLDNKITPRSAEDLVPRYALGFQHSNILPLIFMYLFLYTILIKQEKIKKRYLAIIFLINILLYNVCDSRNSFWIIMLGVIAITMLKLKQYPDLVRKVLFFLTKNMTLIYFSVSLAMTSLLLKGGIYDKIDSLFSGRFRMGVYKIRLLGLHLLNLQGPQKYFEDNIVIDNGYLYMLIAYGFIICIIFIIINRIGVKRIKDNSYCLVAILLIGTANFIDNDILDYSCLPIILLAFNQSAVMLKDSFERKKLNNC